MEEFLNKLNDNKIWKIILIFTLLPFIINSFFNLPVGDDFNFGNVGRNESVLNAVKYWYNNWGGRYTQELLLTIFNPLSFNSQNYFWLPPLILILSICFSFYFLIKTIGVNVLSLNERIIFLTILLFLVFNLMPEIGEVLFWISGAYTFQSGNVFFILLISIWYQLHFNNNLWKNIFLLFLSSVLILLISGTNEVSMLYTFGFIFLYTFYCLFYSPTKIIIAITLLVVSLIFAYISILSPGNFIRAAHTGGLFQDLIKNGLESIIRGLFYLVFWLPSTIVLTFFIWKPLGKISKKYNSSTTNYSKLFFKIVLLFFCVIIAGFFPSLASTGWNPPRTVAPVFIVFILFYFGICIYFHSYISEKIAQYCFLNFTIPSYLVLLFILGYSNQHNVMNAYVDIVSLKSFKYNLEISKVYKQLNSKGMDTVSVFPLIAKPRTLPIRWPDHYNTLVNNELEAYFHKKVLMKNNK